MSNASPAAKETPIEDGPTGWRMWRADLAGVPSTDAWESLLYTNAQLLGTVSDGLGPFQLFSTVADPLTNTVAPRLAIRVRWHDPGQAPLRSKTQVKKQGSNWLAVNVDDELACLLALVLGCRIRAGGKVRTFPDKDPVGRPMYAEHTTPIPLTPAYRSPIMPNLHNIRIPIAPALKPLSRYPNLKSQDAIALVRAARHYATALWVADNDPEQAWLQLVSALETVAVQWKAATTDPVTLFKDHFPEPAQLIQQAGGDDLLAEVAPHFSRLIGASRRVQDFVEAFRPEPPPLRPPNAQVEWTNLRKVTRTIYEHRSALLHNGTPFPAALCVPPLLINEIPEEKPVGITSSSMPFS